MKRGPGPRRDTDKARAFANRRAPIRSKSLRTLERELERAKVVAIVHERAGHRCQYAEIIPEVPCASPFKDRPQLEVDELRGGAHRQIEYLNPDACRLTCQAHHDVKTDGITIAGRFIGKREVLRRLALHEGRTP